ncbi:tetratricopeptide repeat protein [Ruania zhangjianzhongii]|uniref:tetratricopeptide repeat protein n=1 Tax=Ruania zhangjianzhongii TaxID=2603206 RepID=UPI0011CB98D4|nr:tetratricopeptide repeat protein [Ruania zhangjianzhongii]
MTQQPPPSINLHGAVDLSALAAPPPPPPSADTPAGLVLDVTEETFNDVVQQSNQVPVVVLLWQVGEGQSIQLNTTLQTLVTEQAGKFVLARIDVAANPRLAQVFQVQAVPAALAVIKGQPVPLFQGAPAAEQVRPVLDQLLQLAQEQGVTGTVDAGQEPGADDQEPAEPPLPPHIQAAYDAIEADDLDGAVAAFEGAIAENPADAEAVAGLAQVQLLQRIGGLDPAQVLQHATEAPAGDLDAQLPAADLEVAGGRLAEGFARLLQVIRVTAGEDKERARVRLLELFRLAADDAPEVVKARRDLAIALY